ncbi:MAG: sulfurtransferase [Gemmatimonadota bacterium]
MSSTLVSVQQLQQHLADPDWCVVDCRHALSDFGAGRREYEAGHIPGAIFANVEEDLSGAKTGSNGRHPLPDRDALVQTFRNWGIGNRTQIVAYDANGGSFAARLWWLARWLGHARVALLDGGWQAWQAAGGASDTKIPARAPANFEAGESLVHVVDAAQVQSMRGDPNLLLVDVRAPERYRGEQETLDPVAGHVPGAVNRFWQTNLTSPNGTFKSTRELRAELDALREGHAPTQLVTYCGSGVTACHMLIAMEIAGLPGAALYAGSWSEWVADRTRPVATGSAP